MSKRKNTPRILEIENLESLIESFACRKARYFTKENSPFIIEFAGPPQAGKSTLINFFKYSLKESYVIPESSLESPVQKTKALEYMRHAEAVLRKKLIETKESRKESVVLVDCGALSQIALLETFYQTNKIKKEEKFDYNALKETLILDLAYEDLIVYVSIPIEEELERINKIYGEIRLEDKNLRGEIYREEFLREFNKMYNLTVQSNVIKELEEEYLMEIVTINGDRGVEENIKIVKNKIKDLKFFDKIFGKSNLQI